MAIAIGSIAPTPGGICGAACAPEPERDDDRDFDFEDDFDDDDDGFDDEDDFDDDGRDADCEAGCDAEVEPCRAGCAAGCAATDARADGACGVCGACGAWYGAGPGVPVWGAGSSGRCVPGRGMRCGRPGGVSTLPGSVGTRGALSIDSPQRCALLRGPAEPDLSIRLREIERLLSRPTDTMLCGSGKYGAAGSFAGSPRARVDDEAE